MYQSIGYSNFYFFNVRKIGPLLLLRTRGDRCEISIDSLRPNERISAFELDVPLSKLILYCFTG